MDMGVYEKYATYYDLIYSSFNVEEDARCVEKIAQKFLGRKIETILDVGCGTGSHSVYFSRKGYGVWGIDNSKTMVECAKRKIRNLGIKANVLLADARSFRSPKRFDVVVCLFGTIGYLHKDDEIEAFFRNMFNNLNVQHLRDDGVFIFDFPNSEFFERHGIKPSVLEGQKDDMRSIRLSLPTFNPQTKILTFA